MLTDQQANALLDLERTQREANTRDEWPMPPIAVMVAAIVVALYAIVTAVWP